MKKTISLFTLLVLLLSGCTTTNNVAENPCDNDNVKIGVVTDVGGINDKSFNQGTWAGVQEYCSETGVGATYVESTGETDYVPNLKNLTSQEGIEVVVAIGEALQKSVYEVAKDNPDTKYILIDGEPQDEDGNVIELDNVKSYKFNEQESGYLVGYIAGKLTQTNKVGFIGGQEILPVQKFGWGYVQGIEAANPDVEVNYQYSGTFSDSSKGTQIADVMYSSGVDIIFAAAGGTNDGVLNSAKTRVNQGEEVYVIGVDRDMYEDGKYNSTDSVILTSALKNVGAAVKKGLTEAFDGEFVSGTEILGYSEGGVGLPETNPNITDPSVIEEANKSLASAEVKDNKEETKEAIQDLKINGEI